MMSAQDNYTDNLERLNGYFPNIELLTRKDICAFTGLSRHGVAGNFLFTGKYISKANFARMMAETGEF